MFSVLFFFSLVFYVDSQSSAFLIIAGVALMIITVNPKYIFDLFSKDEKPAVSEIGSIIGVQSKNTFLAKLYKDRVDVKRYDFVKFKYSMDEDGRIFTGLIIDKYLLNEELWIKILHTEELKNSLSGDCDLEVHSTPNTVCAIQGADKSDFMERFVGVVVEGSDIGKLKFEYVSKASVSEGDLVEVVSGSDKVLYQIVEGVTSVELLESKNETGLIIGEANQLGVWDNSDLKFDKFGWVPQVNTPVFLSSYNDELDTTLLDDELLIGHIPNTSYPVLLNIKDAISHHMAVLGVTGTGKSVFSRDLIKRISDSGMKVICVDFTNEYSDKLSESSPVPILDTANEEAMFRTMDEMSGLIAKTSAWNMHTIQSEVDAYMATINTGFTVAVKKFLGSDDSIALFELPEVENTTSIFEYTRFFFKNLFEIAKRENIDDKKICIVIEEAHTVIPEWNFVGVNDKKVQPLINNIGQIALQGRKYGVGFLVIAQRTANVSKTILTQCNSIVAFQQFDNTSGDFLSNYIGADMVKVLPQLKKRQAIAVGKGFRSSIPVIFEVPHIDEP